MWKKSLDKCVATLSEKKTWPNIKMIYIFLIELYWIELKTQHLLKKCINDAKIFISEWDNFIANCEKVVLNRKQRNVA